VIENSLLTSMRDGTWLDAQEFPPLEYAVHGVIPEGFGLLVAPPKAGKSWFVAGIGLACAAGGLALGRIKVDKRPVCYWALEDGHRRLQSRFRTLMLGESIPAGINVITKATTHEVPAMMLEFLEAHADKAPLLILDTLGKVKPPKPPGSDPYQVDYAIGAQLKGCVDTVPGASLLVVHHSRKAESPDFVDAVSGTAGIAGSADFVLVLGRKRHSDEAVLSVTGRDIPEAEYALRSDNGLWILDGDNLAAAAQSAEQRRVSTHRSDRTVDILSMVASSSEPVTAIQVAEKLGLENDIAGRYLRRLATDELIAKAGRGLYKRLSEVSEQQLTAGQDDNGVSESSVGVSSQVSESGSEIRTPDTSDTVLQDRQQQIVAERLDQLTPRSPFSGHPEELNRQEPQDDH
jgi:hypothetical protein